MCACVFCISHTVYVRMLSMYMYILSMCAVYVCVPVCVFVMCPKEPQKMTLFVHEFFFSTVAFYHEKSKNDTRKYSLVNVGYWSDPLIFCPIAFFFE